MPEGNVTVSATIRDLTVFTLPAALTMIDKEAFSGIDAECIRVPDNVTFIGARAFADCENLQQIYIPAGVQTIARNSLAGSPGVTVFGQTGSEAESFAKAKGFGFVPVGTN